MQSPYSPSVAPCQDVQCCECGIWFGSDELAKLHTRLFHPTRNVDVLLPPSLSKPRLQKRFKGPTGRVMQGLLTLFCSAHSKSNTLKEKVTQDSQTTAVVVLPLSRPVSRLSASSESRPPPHHTAGVYNNLLKVLASITCQLLQCTPNSGAEEIRKTCQNSYDQLLQIEGQIRGYETVVYLLAESHKFRIQLLSLSAQIGCRSDPRIWEAILKDDDHIVILLREALHTKIRQQIALSLPDAAAESFLTLMTKVLVEGEYTRVLGEPSNETDQALAGTPGEKFRRTLHRVIVRLSQKSHKLPESIYVRGVKIIDRYNMNGGAFADIYKGVYQGEEVAVKKLRATLYQSPGKRAKTIKALCREASIWLHMRHPNVLPFLGIDCTAFGGTACMLSPWMAHGNVHDYIASNGFVEDEVHRILWEVSSGLSYLHQANIVHGDLRGPNILIDQNRHARLSDFGLSNFADSTTASTSDCPSGAIGWSAPELLNPASFGLNHSRATDASDIYAFGSFCWEVYTGTSPFHDIHMGHALTKILAGQRPPRPSGDHEMRQGLWATVKACWRHNPSTRPNAQKVRTFLEEFVSNPRILPTFPPTVDDVESLKSVESSVSTLRRGKGKGRGVGSGGMGIGKEKGKGREVQVGGGGIFSRVQPLGTEETGVFSISFREAQPMSVSEPTRGKWSW